MFSARALASRFCHGMKSLPALGDEFGGGRRADQVWTIQPASV